MPLNPIPEYGDHMTLAEFEANVKYGTFIDWDGSAVYATADGMSDSVVTCQDVQRGGVDPRWTHVVWFNK